MDALDRDRIQIDALQTADIDCPDMRRSSWTAKRKNPADRAEIVGRLTGVEFVGDKVFQRGEQLQLSLFDPVYERATLATYGTVAHAHMIELSVHTKSDAAAVAIPIIYRHAAISS